MNLRAGVNWITELAQDWPLLVTRFPPTVTV
jgi:hypothetical protein